MFALFLAGILDLGARAGNARPNKKCWRGAHCHCLFSPDCGAHAKCTAAYDYHGAYLHSARPPKTAARTRSAWLMKTTVRMRNAWLIQTTARIDIARPLKITVRTRSALPLKTAVHTQIVRLLKTAARKLACCACVTDPRCAQIMCDHSSSQHALATRGSSNATYVHKTRGVQCVAHARLNDAPRMLSCCASASDPRRASCSAARPRKTQHDARVP